MTPSIAMSNASGAVPGNAAPTACAMRPQLGSPPKSAALTSGEFATALNATLLDLALRIVRDGEGARRIGCVRVRGAGEETVERVARAVANLNLMFGLDEGEGLR